MVCWCMGGRITPSRAEEKETAMRCDLVRTSALALAFVGSVGLAAAQQRPPPNASPPANAADDKLITIAYTFKMLTDDDRGAIYEALKGEPAAAVNADVGTKLPSGVELRPVPDEVAARVPKTRGYRYAVANGRVLLVGTSRIVMGVFADANAR